MSRRILTSTLGFALLTTCVATPARAHISLERGVPPLSSRYGDGQDALKEAPCGQAGGTRGTTNIYTHAPGETITVSLLEYIPHPSYFRIAFDKDGDDDFRDPASIKPIDPTRKCPDGPGDHCGESDFYNTPAVLANMDNLDPHLAVAADFSNPPIRTWQVTLPNVECDNCTLQVIQVMEDDAFHGPYDPTPGSGVADIYHQCIDLVLSGGAAGGDSGPGPGSSQSGASSGDSGGCAVSRPGNARTAGAEWAFLALALGYSGLQRRRR